MLKDTQNDLKMQLERKIYEVILNILNKLRLNKGQKIKFQILNNLFKITKKKLFGR